MTATATNPLGIQTGDQVILREPMRLLNRCTGEMVDLEPGEILLVDEVDGGTVHVSMCGGDRGGRVPASAFVPAVLGDLTPAGLAETVVVDVTAPYLQPGQTVIHGSQRYTVDHVERDGDFAAVFTTAGYGATLTEPVSGSLRTVTVRGIPAQPTMGEMRREGNLVWFWSGIRLDGPATLVRRDAVKVGDTVHSSHYGKRVVTEVTQHGTEGQTTEIRFFSNDADQVRNERYDSGSLIPRYKAAAAPAETETLSEALWDAVVKVRDAAPRAVNDADSWDIVEAVMTTLRERGIDVGD